MEVIHKIGRRKTAVARVYVSTGKGTITVNKKDVNTYFPTATLQYKVNQPLALTVYAAYTETPIALSFLNIIFVAFDFVEIVKNFLNLAL